jgi:hypothetical protein
LAGIPGLRFVKKLFDTKPEAVADGVLQQQFRHLNKVERGLADKVIRYIVSGEGRPVLATLEAKKAEIEAAREAVDWQKEEPLWKARAALVRSSRGRGAQVGRLMQALEHGSFRARYFYNVGSDSVPPAVKQLLTELQVHLPSDAVNRDHRMTLEDLIEAVNVAGGTVADLIDGHFLRSYGPNELLWDAKEERQRLLRGEPAAAIEAAKRHDAPQKAAFIKLLAQCGAASEPGYRDFLFDCAVAGSSKLRDAAREALLMQDRNAVAASAIAQLASRKADVRLSMAQLLGSIGTDEALEALNDHKANEKSADVLRLIDHVIGASKASESPSEKGTYISVTGEAIAIPPPVELASWPDKLLGDADLAALRRLDDEENAEGERRHVAQQTEMRRLKAEMEAKGQSTRNLFSHIGKSFKPNRQADAIFKAINAPIDMMIKTGTDGGRSTVLAYLPKRYLPLLSKALDAMAPARAVPLCLFHLYRFSDIFGHHSTGALDAWLKNRLTSGAIDLRQVVAVAKAMGLKLVHASYGQTQVPTASEDAIVRLYCQNDWNLRSFLNAPYRERIWPLLAEHLKVILEFLPPANLNAPENECALELLALFPVLPREALMPVLAAAVGEGRKPRLLAQKLLRDAPGIDEALIGFLADKRQAIRANAAILIGQRRNAAMAGPLAKRLKTENAEAARAAIISAIAMLGGDTSAYLGQETLIAEAKEWRAKFKADGIEWLDTATAPALSWRDGGVVPVDLLDGWLRFANKLKQPAGSPLFDLYLDQFRPEDAAKLGEWLLGSWLAHDTMKQPRDVLQKEAMAEAIATRQQYPKAYGSQTVEELAAYFLRMKLGVYLNSGSESKGVLALARRAPAAFAAKAIGRYLKEHGKRVSQARMLVEFLAAMGKPETIQVLVATATRFRQRTVRETAETLVQTLADERGWTTDELADRSVPTGGLEEGGAMVLEVGPEGAPYTVRLGSDLSLVLLNPQGREIKALPAGDDEDTKEAKALLTDAKKTVKTVISQQQSRLYEAMLSSRRWPLAAWRADIHEHPIVGRLAERVIWRGLDAAGKPASLFRPTPEGEYVLASGDPTDLAGIEFVDIAHSVQMPEESRKSWATHLSDFEVPVLINQIGRPMLSPGDGEGKHDEIIDRKGWLMENFKLRGAAGKLGYERAPAEDGGSFVHYRKAFQGAGIQAHITFTGSYLPEENIPVALVSLCFFEGAAESYGARQLTLGETPPLILSECWNDYRDIAANGAFDPAWRSKGLGYHD